MPGAISAWLEAHGQRTIQPDDIGRIARTIYESVALASAYSLRAIEYVSNTKKDVVYAVGGASRVALLNQMLPARKRRPASETAFCRRTAQERSPPPKSCARVCGQKIRRSGMTRQMDRCGRSA